MNTSDAREQRANEEVDEQLEYERQKGMDKDAFYDYDPTPYYLYDDTGGERPVTSQERHQAAFEQKLRDKG